ncbi:MAG: HAMP domain-containing histidine kinase [Proteobacteria bacterium]|nr:HAMP domain-containing histidine kinase [Pseudomonadota bacterium]MBU4470846.1 HAMP domain-containing histidine kinase [Pseudomonadota bacterium]MCG2753766.1 HAMP domain-containing histidine kinase [Desulfobacteraceae bacterium]
MRSVFTKLLMVTLVAVIGINLLVFALFRAQRQSSINAFQTTMARYLTFLIEDFGTPPDLLKARETVKEAFIQVRYTGTDASWVTDEIPSPSKRLRWSTWKDHPHIRSALWKSRFLIEIEKEQGIFLFALGNSFDQENENRRLLIPLLLILTSLILLIYLSIRWILKPIKWLNQGVSEITLGNLKHQIPTGNSAEFKELARGFNEMTRRIREMLYSKERLLVDVSHELRSPLTRIRVALEFLPESHARVSIRTDVEEMEKMIAEILDAAKLQHRYGRQNHQEINLKEYIKEIIPTYKGQNPGIVFHEPETPVLCRIDPDQIKTVFHNILNNAVKYTGVSSEPIHISVMNEKSHVIVEIEDQGIGIPEEELPFVFEPFYRVDKSRSKETGGYGLGLSICKSIMEAHGGRIEIQSSIGKGVKAILVFPNLPAPE